jgi:hypothetical protein
MKLFKIGIIVFSIQFASAQIFTDAANNGKLANEGFKRCMKYTQAWLGYADPESKLIPRNLQESKSFWNANDAAADNYPFMVLTAAILDTNLLNTIMLEMLDNETRLTSRVNRLPDTYSFKKQDYLSDTVNLSQVYFGSAEYMKDGLLPLTEWMGPSPWSHRMLGILRDFRNQVDVIKEIKGNYYGNSAIVEINGDLLQVLSRMYWLTGNQDYLDWAIKIADYYLLGDNLPTRKLNYLRLRDHGCEIIAGLSELYVTVSFVDQTKKKAYEQSMHDMLDRILEVGRNPDGLFYDAINPRSGEVLEKTLADTWGYTLNAFYSVYLVDKTEAYKQAVLKPLQNLGKYKNYPWEGTSSDGYADAIESALNLYNREPNAVAKDWIESEIKVLWSKQQESGIIEGWHGDGNFARTTIMYCLWKTQGTTILPWRNDVTYGAVKSYKTVKLSLSSASPWSGILLFDKQRHKQVMFMPIDYPRINQFPEWFTTVPGKKYKVKNLTASSEKVYTGEELQKGIQVELQSNKELKLEIIPL